MHDPLPFHTTICALRDLDRHHNAGVTHVVSLMNTDAPPVESLGGFDGPERLELRFSDIIKPASTRQTPVRAGDISRLLDFGRAMRAGPGKPHLLIHCDRGVSRSTAGMALLLADARPDLCPRALFARLLRLRPEAWPSLLVVEIGDAALGRGGALVRGLAGLYRTQIARHPEIAARRHANGRGREVELAENPAML